MFFFLGVHSKPFMVILPLHPTITHGILTSRPLGIGESIRGNAMDFVDSATGTAGRGQGATMKGRQETETGVANMEGRAPMGSGVAATTATAPATTTAAPGSTTTGSNAPNTGATMGTGTTAGAGGMAEYTQAPASSTGY